MMLLYARSMIQNTVQHVATTCLFREAGLDVIYLGTYIPARIWPRFNCRNSASYTYFVAFQCAQRLRILGAVLFAAFGLGKHTVYVLVHTYLWFVYAAIRFCWSPSLKDPIYPFFLLLSTVLAVVQRCRFPCVRYYHYLIIEGIIDTHGTNQQTTQNNG